MSIAAATEKFGFLLVPNYAMLAFVSALEPLRVANRLAQQQLYDWRIFSHDGGPVVASNALSLVADHAIGEATPACDRLVVVASFEPETGYDAATLQWLRRQARVGVALGGIDTGSFLLAKAGLLAGYRATTHWESLQGFAEQFPRVAVGSGLFIIDRLRFTCAGGTAALDMMLHLIRLRHGQQLAAAVSDQFIHARIREPAERQRTQPDLRQGLARALDMMETHLEETLDIGALSEAAGLSRRQLERQFQAHFRCSPLRYYLDLRLQRARALLQYTDMQVVDIALACGFGTAAHFSASYRGWAGHPPVGERRGPRGIVPIPR